MIKSVGVIGLGAMGEVIAGHLLKKNFTVNGYDIVPKRSDNLKSLGLNNYTSLQALAENSDILIIFFVVYLFDPVKIVFYCHNLIYY